jgi:hypothetical protein
MQRGWFIPERLLVFEDIFVALLSHLCSEANIVGLYDVVMVSTGATYPQKCELSHQKIIAILQRNRAIEVGEEDKLGVLEREVQSLELVIGCGSHVGGVVLKVSVRLGMLTML